MASRIRILHLEDTPGDALLVRSVLEADGVDGELVNVASREDYTAALEGMEFDVVLSDYAIPSFGGMEALALTRARNPDLPFIFVSGNMGEELAIETVKAGATDYVLKDRLSRLVPSVQRALSEARDRSERKRAEQELRESERRYRSIVETTNEWIWESDLEGRLTYSNAAVQRLVGHRPEELVGQKGIEFLHPEDAKNVASVVERAIAEKSGWTGWVHRWRHKDGSYRSVESNAATVFGENGEFQGFRGATRDITERLQIEAQLRQAQKMEAIGTLAGGVAHDFNNILTTILGYADLVREQLQTDHPLHEDVQEIQKAAERASALTRQLLAFSRKQMLTPVVLDLNTIVSDLERMLRRLIGEDIDLASVLDPQLGRVKADPTQIEQVILNLCVNARDAMPQGGKLTIETSNLDLDDSYVRRHGYAMSGPHVFLAISDNGTGMDEETRSHIFEPFFTTKGAGKGTGLGLSTVYGIVKQSRGHIEVYSEPGHGTTFKVYLPRVFEDRVPVTPTTEETPAHGSETILLVEDEAPVRALTRRFLEALGYRVLETSGPEEAVRLAKTHPEPLHLMVTDAVMPGKSGPELARLMSSVRPEMKVLFISGYTNDAIVRQGLLKANEAFLQKPFRSDTLARKVRSILDGKS
ncbi:MAG: response regulator [Thermoanaerobaculia bacterium]